MYSNKPTHHHNRNHNNNHNNRHTGTHNPPTPKPVGDRRLERGCVVALKGSG